jgi:hypothetical protein
MPTPPCPRCHGATLLAINKPYCPHCGWNRDVAMANARSSLVMLPIGFVMMGGFVFFMVHFWRFRNPYQIAIFCVVPTVGILINYVVMKRALSKLEALPAPTTRSVSNVADGTQVGAKDAGGKSSGEIGPSAQDQALLRASRPREIRMAKGGRFSLAVALLAVLLFATIIGVHLYTVWARALSFASFGTKDWVMSGIVALLLLVPWGLWRSQVRECDLLENGEIAMGKILRQWNEDNKGSSIEYEFSDYQGQTHRGLGSDRTEKLYESMTVPVFYDRDNPKRQIAYCTTLHEIVT